MKKLFSIIIAICFIFSSAFFSLPANTAYAANDYVWTKINKPKTSNSLRDIVWTGKQFITAGENGIILTSSDGVSWTTRTTGVTAYLFGLVWNGTTCIAVGDNGTIITSTDGIKWEVRKSGTSLRLYSVAWNGSTFVATLLRMVR